MQLMKFSSYVFRPEPIGKKVTVDLTKMRLPEEKEEELNPPPNYKEFNRNWKPKKRKREECTIKPMLAYIPKQQLEKVFKSQVSLEEKPDIVQWDWNYVRHVKKKKGQKGNVIWYTKKPYNYVEPEKKVVEPKDWEFDTSKWRVSRLAQFMNANYWKSL